MPTERMDPIGHLVRSALADVTPTRLKFLLVMDSLAVLVFCLVSITTIAQHEHTAMTVGHYAAPSVFAAHEIATGIEQMDTYLANELLYPLDNEQKPEMARRFEDARAAGCRELVSAAKNITYGKAEEEPIENLLLASGVYQMQTQRTRDLLADGKQAEALAAYLESVATIEEKLLPQARALNTANSDQLEATYSEEKSKSALSCGLVLVIGMVLLGLLLVTQVYLFNRFRRRFNTPLLVASVCVAVFGQFLYSSLRLSTRDLKVAKEDAYDSIVALLDARANAHHACALQSRWLLDRAHSDRHGTDFAGDIAQIAGFEPGFTLAGTIESAQKQQFGTGKKVHLQGFKGALAVEFHNLTFEGEAYAALDALKALSRYCEADTRMRRAENAGKHTEALDIGLGYNPNESKYPFSQFDEALQRLLALNREHFERGVQRALEDLRWLGVSTGVLGVLLWFCIYLGLRPRLAEYLGQR